MPLYSYKCDGCDAPVREMLLRKRSDDIECPACGSHCTWVPGTFHWGYDSSLHQVPAKGEYVAGLGRRVEDSAEYAREMKKAGLKSVSFKDWEAQDASDKREKQAAVVKAKEEVKKEILHNPEVLSKKRLVEKRRELRAACK